MSDQSKGLSLAVLMLVLAVLLQIGLSTYRTHTDQQVLQNAMIRQDEVFAEIAVVRAQLNTIAGKTLELAQQGNANAAAIIQQLQAAGINLSATE